MDLKELRALQEAYSQVYEPQQLDEEVEIATEYFYEMGLTEEGIGILIEELGEEEFVNWIYDIAEEYTLTEARRTGRIEPVTKGGKSVASLKGGAKTAAIARLRREKESARSSEKSSSGTSGMTSALRSQAMKSATSKQAPAKKEAPAQTKKGIGGLIGSVVQRAKQDTALLGKSIQTAKDVATRRGAEVAAGYSALRAKGKEAEQSAAATRARRKATVAAGRAVQAATPVVKKAVKAGAAAAGAGAGYLKAGKSPAAAAGRAAGTLVKKLKEEDVYDVILAHLIDEGYAETVESANAIMVNMSEEWREEILEYRKLAAGLVGGMMALNMMKPGMPAPKVKTPTPEPNQVELVKQRDAATEKKDKEERERMTREYQRLGGDAKAKKYGITSDNAWYMSQYHRGR